MNETLKPFRVKTQNKYTDTQWDDWESYHTKIDAERECLRLVHEANVRAAIVVEMRPVVITRVSRDNGVHMSYHQMILTKEYR